MFEIFLALRFNVLTFSFYLLGVSIHLKSYYIKQTYTIVKISVNTIYHNLYKFEFYRCSCIFEHEQNRIITICVFILGLISGTTKSYCRSDGCKKLFSGEYFFLEDSEGKQCFFVIKGSVKVTRLGKSGREVILALLNEGDFFGEMSLIDGDSRSANVIALENTKVFTLNRLTFFKRNKKIS